MSDTINQSIEEMEKSLGLSDMKKIMLTSAVICIIQAFILGSCLQLVYRYFQQPKRDSALGRMGVLWITILNLCQAFLCNFKTASQIGYMEDILVYFFTDWFLMNLECFFVALVIGPVLVLYARRAWIIWDRSRWVIGITGPLIVAYVFVSLSYSIYGLQRPWGHGLLSHEEFAHWTSTFEEMSAVYWSIRTAAIALQLVITLILCGLICTGLLRHRSGCSETDTAISKIVFICGESLLPMVVLSLLSLVGAAARFEIGSILFRVSAELCPAVYFHGLVTSLVARERVAKILHAEPVRNMAAFNAKLDELASDYNSSEAFERYPSTGPDVSTLKSETAHEEFSIHVEPWGLTTGYALGYAGVVDEGKLRRGSDVFVLQEVLSRGPPEEGKW